MNDTTCIVLKKYFVSRIILIHLLFVFFQTIYSLSIEQCRAKFNEMLPEIPHLSHGPQCQVAQYFDLLLQEDLSAHQTSPDLLGSRQMSY